MSNPAPSRPRSWRRIALACGVIAALGVGGASLAQQPHHGGGGGGAPRGGAPRGYGGPPRGAPGGFRGGPPNARPFLPPGGGWGRGPVVAPAGNPGWDQRQHNGYFVGGRWYPGQPPGAIYNAPGYRPGFVPWRRGAYLPPQYQAFVVTEWGRYHLRRPPPGYNWVQVGSEFLLVSAATGLIFDVVTG